MKKLVFTFGRMNPPTIGHEKLANKIKDVAKKQNATPRIYLSHSQNPNKDPLSYNDKYRFATKAFGIAKRSNSKQIFQILPEIEKEGFTDIIMVVGSDRINEFDRVLKKYNGKDYNFNSIKTVSSGDRDPDAQGVEGMSGSKLRQTAKDGDEKTFKSGLASKLSNADKTKIFNLVRKNLKEAEMQEWTEEDDLILEETLEELMPELSEQDIKDFEELGSIYELTEVLTIQQRLAKSRLFKRLAPKIQRAKKIASRRMKSGAKLMKLANKAAIKLIRKKFAGKKGVNYANLSPSDKMNVDRKVKAKKALIPKIARRLLPQVRKATMARVAQARKGPQKQNAEFQAEVKQDPDIKDREGTQPASYYKGVKKSTKDDRDRSFKKGADKSHKDPSAYPDSHPGDKGAETKPSKHTKKYNQMFGKDESLWANIHKKRKSGRPMRKPGSKGAPTDQDFKNARGESIEEDAGAALKKKSEKSGISVGILRKVYNRGLAAWRTGHRPGATQQQWGMARVNSFITKGSGTWGKADKDLASKVRKEELEEAKSKKYVVNIKRGGSKSSKTVLAKSEDDAESIVINKFNLDQNHIVSVHLASKKEEVSEAKKFKTVGKNKNLKVPVGKKGKLISKGNAGSDSIKSKFPYVEGEATKAASDRIKREKESDKRKHDTMLDRARNIDTRTQNNKEEVNLLKKSDQSGIDINIIKEVYNRGLESWEYDTPRCTQEQWGFARVNSFITKSGATWNVHDKDLAEKVRGPLEIGTDEINATYRGDTPGQTAKKPSYMKVLSQKEIKTSHKDSNHQQSNEVYNVDDDFSGKIKKKRFKEFVKETNNLDEDGCPIDMYDHVLEESEYQGKKVTLNNPSRSSDGKKKFYVYVKNEKGNVVKVGFGDPNMEIKRDDPARRKSFRARHNCANPGPKWKARYWSCYQWRASAKVDN